jgi:hypothetical protein
MPIISLRHRHTNIARGMRLAGTATHVSALRGRSSEVIRVRSVGGVHRTQPTHGFPLYCHPSVPIRLRNAIWPRVRGPLGVSRSRLRRNPAARDRPSREPRLTSSRSRSRLTRRSANRERARRCNSPRCASARPFAIAARNRGSAAMRERSRAPCASIRSGAHSGWRGRRPTSSRYSSAVTPCARDRCVGASARYQPPHTWHWTRCSSMSTGSSPRNANSGVRSRARSTAASAATERVYGSLAPRAQSHRRTVHQPALRPLRRRSRT